MKKLFILIFILGCVAVNSSKISQSSEVTQSFKSRKPLPDHTYYYFGRPVIGVIGIKQPYTFNSGYWKKVGDSQFKLVVDDLYRGGVDQHGSAEAFALLNPEGKHAGVWLSRRHPSVSVNGNVVTAVLPKPFESKGP